MNSAFTWPFSDRFTFPNQNKRYKPVSLENNMTSHFGKTWVSSPSTRMCFSFLSVSFQTPFAFQTVPLGRSFSEGVHQGVQTSCLPCLFQLPPLFFVSSHLFELFRLPNISQYSRQLGNPASRPLFNHLSYTSHSPLLPGSRSPAPFSLPSCLNS